MINFSEPENKTLKGELGKLFTDIRKYIKNNYDLAKLEIIEKIVLTTNFVISSIALLLLVLIFLLFISFAFAYYFGEIFHSNFIGFNIIAGFYFIIILFFLIFKNSLITKPLLKKLMRIFFKTEINQVDSDE